MTLEIETGMEGEEKDGDFEDENCGQAHHHGGMSALLSHVLLSCQVFAPSCRLGKSTFINASITRHPSSPHGQDRLGCCFPRETL